MCVHSVNIRADSQKKGCLKLKLNKRKDASTHSAVSCKTDAVNGRPTAAKMIHSKSQAKRQSLRSRSLLLLAALSLTVSLLGLPLYAKTIQTNSPAGRVMDDIGRGARDIGRGVRDMIDPDRDGILPDGSIDNGIANDGDQFTTDSSSGVVTDHVTGPIPDSPANDGVIDEVLPDTPVTDGSRPSTNPDGTVTDNAAGDLTDGNTTTTNDVTTTSPTTTDPAATTTDANDTADNAVNENGGFRWTGLIIAIVIAVAVVVLICLLIPKKKTH